MIRAFKISKTGVKEVAWEGLQSFDQCWIDCVNPAPSELFYLNKRLGIKPIELKLCLDPNERPKLLPGDAYTVVIFSVPRLQEYKILTHAFGIILLKDCVVTIRRGEVKAVEILLNGKGLEFQLLKDGEAKIAFELMSRSLNEYFSIMDQLEEQIDAIENAVIRRVSKEQVHQVFQIKKTLIYFHKALNANREVIMEIEKGYAKQIPKRDTDEFRILYYDVTQLIDMEGVYRDVLTGILDTYLTSISNNLNDIIKKLTVYASYVLVPTMIASIYGMNFRFMPELYWKYGYAFALLIMVASVVMLYWYFRKKGW
ncbi:magnesium/cobalt transporter CorA [Candidatus Woesearchaeota archaeon]|nr:magnesium/cobalt transporter CorA [Candidatus Woesearchaeota archaeon]